MYDKLETFLRARQARYQVVDLGGAVTAQQRAAALSASGWTVAKVLLVKERDGFVMAVIPASCVLDLNRLKGLIGHGDVRLATAEEAWAAVPDCRPGAIPPFGPLFHLRTFVDRTLLNTREITMPGGDLLTGIRMRPAEYRRLAEPHVGDFAVREAVLASSGAWLPGTSSRRRARARTAKPPGDQAPVRRDEERTMATETFYRTVMETSGDERRETSKRATAAVFHALRDRLTPEEADQAAAQLPTELKEVWAAGDRPGRRPVKMDREEFCARVQQEAALASSREARWMTLAVFAALKEQLSPGEAEDVFAQLPKDLKEIWAEAQAERRRRKTS
jgi:Ala-tRNA(Pro) deacylase